MFGSLENRLARVMKGTDAALAHTVELSMVLAK